MLIVTTRVFFTYYFDFPIYVIGIQAMNGANAVKAE